MVSPILMTKLYAPRLRASMVPRPALIKQLNGVLDRKLTLLAAPAGSGKSSLMAAWMEQAKVEVLWLSLDQDDNDPYRFLSYVAAAFQPLKQGIGEAALAAFQLQKPPTVSSILTAFINEIALLWEDVVLVLDDYHVITSSVVNEAMTFLLENQPPNLHLVMTSRTDPPLPLSKLRVRGQLLELRGHDLNFSLVEARHFLNDMLKIDLPMETVAALEKRTEGWIAGLQLAALSLQGRPDTDDFVEAFAGSNRYIIDYLADEVLHRQAPPMQIFLLQTSLLERFNADLCNHITGRDDSQQMLEKLDSGNLFLISLDDRREWYRYHHLFMDFLRHRANESFGDELPDIHAKAATWFAERKMILEAIRHYLAAGKAAQAGNLVSSVVRFYIGRGDTRLVRQWLRLLPDTVIAASPDLMIMDALVRLVLADGTLDSIERQMQTTERLLEKYPADDHIHTEFRVYKALLLGYQGKFLAAIELGEAVFNRIPPDNLFLASSVRLILAMCYRADNRINQALQMYREAIEISGDTKLVQLTALENMAEIYEVQGKLDHAADVYNEALTIAQADAPALVGMALTGLGKILRERHQVEAAREHLEKARESSTLSGVDGVFVDASLTLALIEMALGNAEEAEAILTTDVAAQIEVWRSVQSEMRVDAFMVRAALLTGKLHLARQWREKYKLDIEGKLVEVFYIEFALLARIMVIEREYDAALKFLSRLLADAKADQRMGHVIELLTVQAIAYHQQGNQDQAIESLKRALQLGEPQGFMATFLLEGAWLMPVLKMLQERRFMPDYVGRILAAMQPEPSDGGLLEPLSDRELDVLRLLGVGMSSTEIAAELFISANTVRTHIKSIYSKLNVHKRLEAVERARELKLI